MKIGNKILVLLSMMIFSSLCVFAVADSCTVVTPASGSTVDRETGITFNVTTVVNASYYANCVIGGITTTNNSENDTNFDDGSTYTPSDSLAGCRNTLTAVCTRGDAVTTSCTSSQFCVNSYTTTDLDDIAVDTIAETGVQTKIWIPLLVLGGIALLILWAWKR